jgi:hypothetical protein
MMQELLIKASPWDVARLAHDLTRRAQLSKKATQYSFGPFHVVNWRQVKERRDVDSIVVEIEGEIAATDQTDGVTRLETLLGFPGRVEAYSISEGNSRLILTVKDEYWSAVAPNWELYYQGMEQLGWLEQAGMKQGGRPHKSSNVWAYQQVHVFHRDPMQVYREWLDRDEANRLLADPLDSFKKAIKRKKGN